MTWLEDAKKRCEEVEKCCHPNCRAVECKLLEGDLPRALELLERAKNLLELRDNWPSGYDHTLSVAEREWLNEVEG